MSDAAFDFPKLISNHTMKIYTYISILILSFSLQLNAEEALPEVSSETRLESATEHLTDQPNQIAVYTKGAICSSCAIGIRIHNKKLGFVDTKKFNSGILLDVKNQLVVVALKEGETYDANKVRDAIHKAGYDPVHYYVWDGKAVSMKAFAEK